MVCIFIAQGPLTSNSLFCGGQAGKAPRNLWLHRGMWPSCLTVSYTAQTVPVLRPTCPDLPLTPRVIRLGSTTSALTLPFHPRCVVLRLPPLPGTQTPPQIATLETWTTSGHAFRPSLRRQGPMDTQPLRPRLKGALVQCLWAANPSSCRVPGETSSVSPLPGPRTAQHRQSI